ncbi:MFS multidrug transporter-like protein, partial [Aureobasidium melanogenum]|uniref:MFS multidrug transporter-like protein n=1 Tax=Aureobasidium melanogenum (strain CBS 110374) TaxID=1043003 RepID=A0A074WJZ6_AURM1
MSDQALQSQGSYEHSKTKTLSLPPKDNPRNWPTWKKWVLVSSITFVDLTVSWGASGFSPASTKFAKDFGVSSEIGTLGLSIYVAGLALGPMSLAPLSEYFGRTPLYIIPYGCFLLFLLGTALVQNLGGFLVLRFLSGFFSSVTVANFGGTIADLWDVEHTGIAMSIFLWAATCGSPSGYFLMSWVAQYRGWRDVFWALLGICGGAWIIVSVTLLLCGETRHSVLLLRHMKAERRRTGRDDLDVPEEMKRRGIRQLFKIALTRPFRFLFSEAIVIFAALYNGYLYGLSFLFNGAFSVIFGPSGKGFETYQVGLTFLGICVGISLGPLTNLWQERYYQRRIQRAGGKNIPEARVQLGQVAAVTFPISLFIFAFTSYVWLSWVGPVIASGLWGWSFYILILMTYTYIEDSYGQYSASALAAVGLARNAAGAGFPLFGRQMFVNEGYQYAGLILACLALVLMPIPFILGRYGLKLRQKSPWASEIMEHEGQSANQSDEEAIQDEEKVGQ